MQAVLISVYPLVFLQNVNASHCPYCDTEYGVFRHGETWIEKDPCVEYICNVRACKTIRVVSTACMLANRHAAVSVTQLHANCAYFLLYSMETNYKTPRVVQI